MTKQDHHSRMITPTPYDLTGVTYPHSPPTRYHPTTRHSGVRQSIGTSWFRIVTKLAKTKLAKTKLANGGDGTALGLLVT